jgi:hypothetical protein
MLTLRQLKSIGLPMPCMTPEDRAAGVTAYLADGLKPALHSYWREFLRQGSREDREKFFANLETTVAPVLAALSGDAGSSRRSTPLTRLPAPGRDSDQCIERQPSH